MRRIAVVPGSFDPITLGHMDVIARATKLFDEVHVVVVHNPDKHALLPIAQRVTLIEEAIEEAGLSDNVVVASWSMGLLVDYCSDVGATVLIKGIRTLHPAPAKQAAPLLLVHLEQAVGWLEQQATLAQEHGDWGGVMRHRRDIALVLIGFWRGFRSDELARLQVEHTQVEAGAGITFYLPHSKGDRQHLGATYHTPALKKLCPVQAYIDWITEAALVRGPVFAASTAGAI